MLGTLLGNYRVVKQLGEGGMGVVYLGRHETLSRRVVVKVLKPEMSRNRDMLQRFFNEAQAATAIHNPGIVQVFDYGAAPDGSAFIVMELLEGDTLTARLEQRRLDAAECCRIARQIANVLQAAHEVGITHRDLKPDNLFLIPDAEVAGGERVKVLDFGIAKLASDLHAAGVRTGTGEMMGTPSYMSPEQVRGAVTAEPRSDIYSLGCILFEMVCGRAPFSGAGVGLGDIIGAHLHTPPPHPHSLAPDAPPALADLILHLLAKKPSARPQTMAAVSQRLDEILRTLGGPTQRAPTPLPEPTAPFAGAAPLSRAAVPSPQPARAAAPLPARIAAPSPAPAPTPARSPAPPLSPAPAQRHPHVRPPTPVPGPYSTPLSQRPPLHPPGPQPPPHNAAATTGKRPPPHTRQRRYVIGGVILALAITTTALALSTDAPAPPQPSPPPPSALIPPPPSPATATPVRTPAPAPAPPPLATAAPATEKAAAPLNADELQLECQQYETARKWDDLGRCAERLKPLDPQQAADLLTRASEETKAMPRLAAIEASLRAKDLKRAKSELDQLWPQSLDYSSIKRKYDLAETQAITDLAAQLSLAKSSDCKAHAALLAKERPSKPPRVITEATRRSPCSPMLCIADAYAEKGQDQFAQGQLAAALASYEAAYACRATPQWAEKAFIIACNLSNRAKAKLYWKQLSPPMKSRILTICVRNGLSAEMLFSP